ncbi:MAG: DUF3575 domain-containing protein [Bacteroidetes bacterium]|nr:DUF3575 domain-containing protein [Bacteroidota bacterium]
MKQFAIALFALFCVASSSNLNAQVDVKINPIGLLFSNLNVAAEFGVSDNFGVEVAPGFGWNRLNLLNDNDYSGSVVRVGVNGRYYLNPNDKGLNGFYIGGYTRYAGGTYTYKGDTETDKFNSTRFALGFLVGGKIVARNEKLIFDFGTGFGRALVYKFTDPNGSDEVDLSDIPFANWDIPFYLSIGYRFGGGK